MPQVMSLEATSVKNVRENVKNESDNLSLFGKDVVLSECCRHARLHFINGRKNRINMLIPLEIKSLVWK